MLQTAQAYEVIMTSYFTVQFAKFIHVNLKNGTECARKIQKHICLSLTFEKYQDVCGNAVSPAICSTRVHDLSPAVKTWSLPNDCFFFN